MRADFLEALQEVQPAFGSVVERLEAYRLHGVVDYGARFQHLMASCRTLVQQVRACGRGGAYVSYEALGKCTWTVVLTSGGMHSF